MAVDLQGLMWWQLASAMDRKKEIRTCVQCGNFFTVRRGAKAAHPKRYCSNACKAVYHRVRKEKAREMAEGGSSVAEMASELDTTEKIVSGWIEREE